MSSSMHPCQVRSAWNTGCLGLITILRWPLYYYILNCLSTTVSDRITILIYQRGIKEKLFSRNIGWVKWGRWYRSGKWAGQNRLCLQTSGITQVPLVWLQFNGLWTEPLKILEKEMATHSIILAWKILWTEQPGSLQSMGSQGIGPNRA